MKPGPSFQLATTPLGEGVTLIEASAGTGKTFTIAGLFLRLILERDFSVREILVVTFTEAATEELRARIRKALADAATAFRTGGTDDKMMRALIAPHQPRAREMLARLDHALAGFDEAPIFTIHSFCQRALRDRAFESGALFDTELLTDDSALLREIAEDYWRRRFYGAETLPVCCVLKNRWQPTTFLSLLRNHQRHPTLQIISGVDDVTLDEVEAQLQKTFDQARHLWLRERANLFELLTSGWAIGDHKKPDLVQEAFAGLDACFADAGPTPEALASLKFFATSELVADTSKKAQTPKHPFFDLCETLLAAEADYSIKLRLDFLDFAKTELPRRKQRLKVQTFDDLLTRLRAALAAPGGAALAREVRAKYRAALIDEFQDTDPVQYQIFRGIFGAGDAEAARPLLFLIGDPKQAIYGFRGADVFTYLAAAASVDQRYTLETNWRSERKLVAAINAVFQFAPQPFVFEEIHFQPVLASGKADQTPLTEAGVASPPLHLWLCPREEDAANISKETAEEFLPARVASEIARLLNGDTRLGTERLGPRDIAVLVPENRQARLMQDALRAANIPSVLHTEESVFASLEARELERVLAALAQPGRERLLKAALATDLLGVSGTALDALTREDQAWAGRVERFEKLHEVWQQKGFTPMFRAWLHEEQIRQRLLNFPDGERRLTNLLHLAEVLHRAGQEQRLGAGGLVRWLGENIASEERAAEEHQLRLERDDQAVKLVTLHKSKGLEYPIVFCPFSWKSSEIKRGQEDQVFFHRATPQADGSVGSEFIRDFGTEDFAAHARLAVQEKLAENLRLLYVAFTRARHRCYFVWGGFNKAGTAAATWLFHRPPSVTADLKASLDAHFKNLDDDALRRDLERLVASSCDAEGAPTIQLTELPAASSQTYLPPNATAVAPQPRVFSGHIPAHWRIASFSMLTADQREERPDYDALEVEATPKPVVEEPPPTGIFTFPRGANPGTCLHKIFEEIDFTPPHDDALDAVVREKLRGYGFDAATFAPIVGDAVRRTLAVPLDPARPGFTLAQVTKAERLNELEFYFPLNLISPALLASGFADATPERDRFAQLARLDFKPVDGFLKGFIDLVFRHEGRFYLVDWKSNWLGARVEDYDAAAMAREMAAKSYSLQYHLYTVALHQYLALRLPDYDYEKHFGGVFYLFLRGIDPARPEFGVFRDRPAVELVEKLSALLVATPAEVEA